MNFWIFQFNPAKYRLQARLADPKSEISWRVSPSYRQQVIPGDTAFVWQSGKDRGIRAVLRVDSVPSEMPEMEGEQQYCIDRDSEVLWRVLATITHRDISLSHTKIQSTPGLKNLSVLHGFRQKTTFPVTHEEGRILLKLINDETA